MRVCLLGMTFVLMFAHNGSIGFHSFSFCLTLHCFLLLVDQNLLSWLRKQKERGYSVVGLEQTSSSVPLSELSFPERTVLLLGKEKEGIPVKFLQVVDVCVEIPQLGVIRSLNVHVSASLAIWEYTKQMMNRSIPT